MDKIRKTTRFILTALSFLCVYLFSAWLFLLKFGFNLFAANALALIASLVAAYSLSEIKSTIKNHNLLLLSALFISLMVSEYFTYFFTEYGRTSEMLAIGFSAIISMMYFFAINIFIKLNDNNSDIEE